MKLLIVDGSNVVMRAAFGGEIGPAQAVPIATGMIERQARECGASHLVVALDCPGETNWRRVFYPDYKANRDGDTGPWLRAAWAEWSRRGWYVENQAGYEADDIIATVAGRAKDRAEILIYSSDSDLWPLAELGARILRPLNGGKVDLLDAAAICKLKSVATPCALVDLKAMTGDDGDNIPGVPGIGPTRAAQLLALHRDLEGVLTIGRAGGSRYSILVAQHEEAVRRAHKLVTLCATVPTPLISPKACAL